MNKHFVVKDPKKILVIDNNPTILKLMKLFLDKEGHDVSLAKDAFSAIDCIKKITPDIIFVDLVMPRISGENLCRIFRDLANLNNCHIVIVSAVLLESNISHEELGIDGCIAKGPFEKMIPCLRDAIQNSDYPRQSTHDFEIKGSENFQPRQVTKELLSHNNHLKIMLESISQGVLEIISQRVIYFNKAAVFLLGTRPKNLLGSYIFDCFDEQAWDQVSKIIKNCTLRSQVEMEISPVTVKDRHLLVQCLRVENKNDHKIVLLTDITVQKKMESVIEATNLAENLGYIFSGIRHEIGNPVGSIKMALGVLKKNMDSYDKQTVSAFVDRSLEEVGRIEYLLKELKNYSLFEHPDIKKVRLDLFLKNFISLVKIDLENRELSLNTKLDTSVRYAFVDDRALHQIMLNLLTNAADAVEGRDEPMIGISVNKTPRWIEIKVKDNGIGISPVDQKNLFKPFFTSKAKGTGLGLVIVKKMLLKMNGHIQITSDENKGTTVTLQIPETSP